MDLEFLSLMMFRLEQLLYGRTPKVKTNFSRSDPELLAYPLCVESGLTVTSVSDCPFIPNPLARTIIHI